MRDEPLIFLAGPTAAGKSEVAVELALRIGGEIVSADSMQVYRGMDIGTAKLPPAERRGVPHHLLDVLEVAEDWDVAKFRKLAQAAMDDIRARHARPIIVGGSGLYMRALLRGLFEGPGRDETARARLETLDTPTLRRQLEQADPAAVARIHSNDRRRMIRALECFAITNRPISEMQTQWRANSEFRIPNSEFQLIGLQRPRPEIYGRCDRRVDLMMERGLIGEVKNLLQRGLKPDSTAGKAIGYAEAICYLAGEFSFENMIKKVKQRTRRFAKHQWTWFRHETGIRWLDMAETETTGQIVDRLETLLGSPPTA